MQRIAVVLARDWKMRSRLSCSFGRNWQVAEVCSPGGAKEILATLHVDLILVDLDQLDPREVTVLCQDLQTDELHPNAKIIVLASAEATTTICDTLGRLIDGVLRKPLSPLAVQDLLYTVFPDG